MTVPRRITEYLEENGVEYDVIAHEAAYTAQETAAAQGVTGCNHGIRMSISHARFLLSHGVSYQYSHSHRQGKSRLCCKSSISTRIWSSACCSCRVCPLALPITTPSSYTRSRYPPMPPRDGMRVRQHHKPSAQICAAPCSIGACAIGPRRAYWTISCQRLRAVGRAS